MKKTTTISNTIRSLRQKAGYTQSQVSQKLNIQRQTYCNYENATRTPPLEIITALSELYQVSIDYLIFGTDRPAPPAKAAVEPSPVLGYTEQKLLDDFSDLSDQVQQEVLSFVQFKKLFHHQE